MVYHRRYRFSGRAARAQLPRRWPSIPRSDKRRVVVFFTTVPNLLGFTPDWQSVRLSAAWADTTGCAYPATEPMESFVSSERLSGRKLEHAYGSYSAGAGVQLVFHIPQGRRCPVKTNWGTSEEYTLPHYLLGEFFGCTGASFFQLWVVALSDLSFFFLPLCL